MHRVSKKTGGQVFTRLVMMRHGQSIWNRDKVFTGWSDIPLSAKGKLEAEQAGKLLQNCGFTFDCCYTSLLHRASETASIALSAMQQADIPIQQCWRLNERHYGALQGTKYKAVLKKFGIWPVLRTQILFSGVPPLLSLDDPRFPGNQACYAAIDKTLLPRGESLKQVSERIQPYWQQVIRPQVQQGKQVLIVAHKNVLRTLMMQLDHLSEWQVMKRTLATARPLVYELDHACHTVQRYYVDEMQ